MKPPPISSKDSEPTRGVAGRIAGIFVESKLTPVAIIASIILGAFAVIMLPRWGADPRVEGQALADALNEASRSLQVLRTFGTNPVLVNYPQPTAHGDPAFAIALLDRGAPPPH